MSDIEGIDVDPAEKTKDEVTEVVVRPPLRTSSTRRRSLRQAVRSFEEKEKEAAVEAAYDMIINESIMR